MTGDIYNSFLNFKTRSGGNSIVQPSIMKIVLLQDFLPTALKGLDTVSDSGNS